ncbi:hypothetical protein AB4K20DRAFT_1892829 [Rhizopus microsporus]
MYSIFCFMKEYRHRETKGYLYSNRQITDDYMCQLKAIRAFKKSNQAIQADDGRKTVIAYGDASLSGMKKGHTPIPVKRTQSALPRKAIVISVDEFRTSIITNVTGSWIRNMQHRH